MVVQRTFPQRTAIQVSASVGDLESVFSTRLVNRIDARGERYYSPASTPAIPSWLTADVDAVTGLDTRPVMRAS